MMQCPCWVNETYKVLDLGRDTLGLQALDVVVSQLAGTARVSEFSNYDAQNKSLDW